MLHKIVSVYSTGSKISQIVQYETLSQSSVSSFIKISKKTKRIGAYEEGGSKKRNITELITRFIQKSIDTYCILNLQKFSNFVFNNFQLRIRHTTVFNS